MGRGQGLPPILTLPPTIEHASVKQHKVLHLEPPKIHLTKAEKDEEENLQNYILNSKEGDGDLGDGHYAFPVRKVEILGDVEDLGQGEVLCCKKILVSMKTRRIVFLTKNDSYYQVRACHLHPEKTLVPHCRKPLVLTLRFNHHMRRTSNIRVRFSDAKNKGSFEQVLQEIIKYPEHRFCITPEVLYWEDGTSPTSLPNGRPSPVAHWELLRCIEETFTDIVYGKASGIFSLIASGFDKKGVNSEERTAMHVKNAFRISSVDSTGGLPMVVISDHQHQDLERCLSRIEKLLDSDEVELGPAVDFSDPLRCLPVTGNRGTTAMHHYGAHIRPNVGKASLTCIHLSLELADLFSAAFQQCKRREGSTSSLVAVAAVKLSVVHESAHMLVRALGNATSSTPDLRDKSWIMEEMLNSSGKPDSGFITEVEWLGHRTEVIYDDEGNLALFFQTNLGGSACLAEWQRPASANRLTLKGSSIGSSVSEETPNKPDQEEEEDRATTCPIADVSPQELSTIQPVRKFSDLWARPSELDHSEEEGGPILLKAASMSAAEELFDKLNLCSEGYLVPDKILELFQRKELPGTQKKIFSLCTTKSFTLRGRKQRLDISIPAVPSSPPPLTWYVVPREPLFSVQPGMQKIKIRRTHQRERDVFTMKGEH